MKKYLFILLLTIAGYGQTYQNPTFGTVTSKTNVEDNSAEKILVQNSLGKLNWIYKNSLIPDNFTKVVYVNNNNPNGATIFDLNNPPVTNDNLLKSDVNNLYIGTDASTWVYNVATLNYITKVVTSATSNFYIQGTTTDSGNSKTASIIRSGNINTTGRFIVGAGTPNETNLWINKDITGDVTSQSILVDGVVKSDVTTAAFLQRTRAYTQAASFTLPNLYHNQASQGIFGAGSSVTNQYGYVAESTLIGATNNYGFFGNIPMGANRWNIYMYGTASNYINSNLFIGSATTNAYKLSVTSDLSTVFRTISSLTTGQTISASFNDTSMIALSTGVNNSAYVTTADYGKAGDTFIRSNANSLDLNITNTSSTNGAIRFLVSKGGATVTETVSFLANGSVKLSTTPTTSAGTYDLLTRNTSTGIFEKVSSSSIATVASPTFTGNPTAPTPTAGDNDTSIATTAFVTSAIATAKPYKVYVALITQTGTSAPTAIVLENTLGGAISWSYLGIGSYSATMPMTIALSKTTVQLTNGLSNANVLRGGFRNANEVQIVSTSDGSFTNAFLEIRVYN